MDKYRNNDCTGAREDVWYVLHIGVSSFSPSLLSSVLSIRQRNANKTKDFSFERFIFVARTIKRCDSTAGVICRSPPSLKCRQTIDGLCRDRPYHCFFRACDDYQEDPHGVKDGLYFLFFTHFMCIMFWSHNQDGHRRGTRIFNGEKQDLSSIRGQFDHRRDLRQHSHELNTKNMIYKMNSLTQKYNSKYCIKTVWFCYHAFTKRYIVLWVDFSILIVHFII